MQKKINRMENSNINISNIEEMDGVDKPGLGIIANKLDIHIANAEKLNKENESSINTAAKHPKRQLAVKYVATRAFLFFFSKVIYLFFPSLKLKTSSSLAISSMFSSIDTSVKQDIFSFK